MRTQKKGIVIALVALLMIVSSAALAQDVRINPPPYHFGGDALFCNQSEGCKLLDKDGTFLWSWTQAEVDAAYSAVGATGAKTQVGGDGTGTYGVAQLWVLPPEQNGIHNRLCFFGYDEWLKDNFMCFLYTADGVYVPLGLAPAMTAEGTPEPVPDCSMWTTGEFVRLIADPDTWGEIMSLNVATGEVTFLNYGGSNEPITAGCDEIEITFI